MKRLLRDIGYFFILALMIIGITGVIYHTLGENGWVERFLGGMLDQGIMALVLGILGLLLVLWIVRRWLHASQANALLNDSIMYALVALGVFFLGRLIMHGSL